MRSLGEVEIWYRQGPHPQSDNPQNGRIITTAEIPSTQKVTGLSPTSGNPAQGSCTRKTSPQNVALKVSRACIQESQRTWEIETWHLKSEHKISHALSPNAQAVIWKEPGSDSLADLGEPSGEAGGNWLSSRGHRCWQHQYLGAHSNKRTLVLEAPFCSTPYSI